jgi:hypothetical protein
MKNSVEIIVGEELFRFVSYGDWVSNATKRFQQSGRTDRSVLCIDTKGRICNTTREFTRARDEDAFPVKAYVKVV